MGRGAAGAEWDGGWGGVGLWSGLCPLHRKSFKGFAPSTEKVLTLCLKIVHLGVYSDKNSQFSTLSHRPVSYTHLTLPTILRV